MIVTLQVTVGISLNFWEIIFCQMLNYSVRFSTTAKVTERRTAEKYAYIGKVGKYFVREWQEIETNFTYKSCGIYHCPLSKPKSDKRHIKHCSLKIGKEPPTWNQLRIVQFRQYIILRLVEVWHRKVPKICVWVGESFCQLMTLSSFIEVDYLKQYSTIYKRVKHNIYQINYLEIGFVEGKCLPNNVNTINNLAC